MYVLSCFVWELQPEPQLLQDQLLQAAGGSQESYALWIWADVTAAEPSPLPGPARQTMSLVVTQETWHSSLCNSWRLYDFLYRSQKALV